MATFDANRFKREMQAAQRKLIEAGRQIDAHNRRVQAHNKQVVDRFNRGVAAHNQEIQRVNAHNARVVGDLQRRVRSSSSVPRYTAGEQVLAERVQGALVPHDDREFDIFLSYAQIDGSEVARALQEALTERGVRVWFDHLAIVPGSSQSLQMDKGLSKARAGVVVLTPAYLVGRFWTERELGALLHKRTLIPVLHDVSFDDVAQYSGILPDLAGFETARDDIEDIAEKIAGVVVPFDASE